MRGALNYTVIISLAAFFIFFGCSHPDPDRLMRTGEEQSSENGLPTDTLTEVVDSTLAAAEGTDIDEALDKAEYYYAIGVRYFQVSQLDSAQAAYEQSLQVLSELDLDPGQSPVQAARMERLLNEVEQDYRLTLMSSGKLYSESSVEAFRELFDELKNLKKLKETEQVKTFDKADTAIFDIAIEWNEKVENSLIYLQTVAREKFTTFLERSAKYLPIMENILKERGLPHDLVYLPLIESGFNAGAYSYARASGFWQFISSTGRLYGLEHNWWYDERRDFEKSTEAAGRHLRDLYDEFGSWNLALAAYNGGAGRVAREIKKSKSTDFWRLRLHQQTRSYVPLFMAATIIAKQPEKYGFFPNYELPLEYDKVTVTKCISFNNIAAKTDIEVSDLEELNPELLRGVTPPNLDAYQLRVPRGYKDVFLAAYNDIPSEKATTWVKHKIRKGETIATIARKYGVSVASILQSNDLGKNRRIYAGQVITIPVPAGRATKQSSAMASAPKNQVVKQSPNKYLVKEGDTLWDIATAYGVSIGEIKRLNEITTNRVYAGRWLRIPSKSMAADLPGRAESSRTTSGVYVVRRGDNLSSIADRCNTTIAGLKEANNLKTSRLYPGMRLKVPSRTSSDARYADAGSGRTADPAYDVYTVRSGDTLYRIAKSYDIGVDELARWNDIDLRSRLYPGDKLKIYFK